MSHTQSHIAIRAHQLLHANNPTVRTYLQPNGARLSPDEVIDTVCDYFLTDRKKLFRKVRSVETVQQRNIAWHLLREWAGSTLKEIAAYGTFDHTTVMYGLGGTSRAIKCSPYIKSTIAEITHLLKEKCK